MGNKAIFLDRDDTLIDDPSYINHPDQVELLPGVCEALVQLRKMGYKLIVVSNQSGVARGIVSEEVLELIHQRLRELLARENAHLDAIYYCPYHPEGVIEDFRAESDLRKPNPGMLLRAADELDIDLEASWMIGDSYRDVTAGKRAGCKTILINSPAKPVVRKQTDPIPNKEAVNIKEAANIIRMVNIQQVKPEKEESQTEAMQSDEVLKPFKAIENAVKPEPEKAAEKVGNIETVVSKPPAEAKKAEPVKLRTVKPKIKKDKPMPESTDKTQELLEDILAHLKRHDREQMFEEFSIYKLLRTISQVIVFFCLLLSLWFAMDPTRSTSSVHTALGYAVVMQLMVIAICLMEKRK